VQSEPTIIVVHGTNDGVTLLIMYEVNIYEKEMYCCVSMVTVARTTCRNVTVFVHCRLKSSGHYMSHQFNIQQLYVLLTQCIYVFCVDLRTNSDYFPIQL